MMMPSLFTENLFDDLFDDFTRPAKRVVKYNAPSASVMSTDVKENDRGYDEI